MNHVENLRLNLKITVNRWSPSNLAHLTCTHLIPKRMIQVCVFRFLMSPFSLGSDYSIFWENGVCVSVCGQIMCDSDTLCLTKVLCYEHCYHGDSTSSYTLFTLCQRNRTSVNWNPADLNWRASHLELQWSADDERKDRSKLLYLSQNLLLCMISST